MSFLNQYIAVSIILFIIGLYCLIFKRNMIRLLIAIEIMLNSINLNFIAFSKHYIQGIIHLPAHVYSILSICIGGCIISVGLVLVIYAYRHYKTLDISELRRLKH